MSEAPRPVGLEDRIAAVSALSEPVRRALYEHVASSDSEVSRDQAARALGISRVLAAFHLDRLVRAGLLEAGYRRLSGRRGPGAGRPSKLYRRSGGEVDVSLPPRRYELVAGLLADSLEDPRAVPARDAVLETASAFGASMGGETRRRAGARPGRKRLLELALEQLRATGFEPHGEDRVIRLRNCPFGRIAQRHRDLVCGANLSLLRSFLEVLGLEDVEAALEPEAGGCCVVLHLR